MEPFQVGQGRTSTSPYPLKPVHKGAVALPKPRPDSGTRTHPALCPVLPHGSLQGSRGGNCCVQTTPPMSRAIEGKSLSCRSGETAEGVNTGLPSTVSARLPTQAVRRTAPAGAHEQTPPLRCGPAAAEVTADNLLAGGKLGDQRHEQLAQHMDKNTWVLGSSTKASL